jgi:thiol:disulfide interchange protein DsbD
MSAVQPIADPRFPVRLRKIFAAVPALLVALLAAPAALAIGEDEYLQPEQAFQYTATADASTVTVEWKVTKGYYLYKKRMGLASGSPGITVGEPAYPKGEIHKDEFFGEQEVFRGDIKVTAPLAGAKDGDTLSLKIKWQGCADAGLCYPPSEWEATVKIASATAAAAASADKLFAKPKSVVAGEDEYLDPEVAFVLTGDTVTQNTAKLNWRIADGYYLYRQRIELKPVDAAKPVGTLVLPKGESHTDEYFGEQEIYRQSLDASFSVPPGSLPLEATVTYQGCADAGLCYPPITKKISMAADGVITVATEEGAVANTVAAPAPGAAAATAAAGTGDEEDCYISEQDSWAAKIKNGNIILVLLGFFGTGLLLAFTPCVLPMVPILSGIIAGSGENTSTRRSFMLSVAYVLGMALTYTAAGIAAGAIGKGFNLQATFNQPWILILFSLLFVVLASSMFGLFTIEMPNFIQTRLSNTSNKQQAGTYAGVAVMGALSALIVSACVAPPLIAALTVISQTGEIARGGAALFAMSLGMGTPLLLVGASAGKLLPKAGAWMDVVKNIFGVLFLAVAAWMLSRIAPEWAILPLWAVPAFALAWVLWRGFRKSTVVAKVARALAVAAGLYGVSLVTGAALGGTDPLAPIPQLSQPKTPMEFKRIKTLADLQREVAAAKAANRSVMLDFYADWCVSCKEMEHYTFTEKDVKDALKNTTLLQADVTANDAEDKELLQHFGIFGPPTIAFYSADGVEQRHFRVVGFMKAEEFAKVSRLAISGRCKRPS